MVENILVSYCGLYCDLCGARNDTPERAQALIATLKQSEIDHWGTDIPDFPEFWRFLNGLTEVPVDKWDWQNTFGSSDGAQLVREAAQAEGPGVACLQRVGEAL